jgi:hypothetical protein
MPNLQDPRLRLIGIARLRDPAGVGRAAGVPAMRCGAFDTGFGTWNFPWQRTFAM